MKLNSLEVIEIFDNNWVVRGGREGQRQPQIPLRKEAACLPRKKDSFHEALEEIDFVENFKLRFNRLIDGFWKRPYIVTVYESFLTGSWWTFITRPLRRCLRGQFVSAFSDCRRGWEGGLILTLFSRFSDSVVEWLFMVSNQSHVQ